MKRVMVLLAGLLVAGCAGAEEETAPTEPPVDAMTPTAETTTPAVEATFDCSDAESEAEEFACADPYLAGLEMRVASEYQRLTGTPRVNASALRTSQGEWRRERDECMDRPDARLCLIQAYLTRLVELHIEDPETSAPTEERYECPNGRQLVAEFYNYADPQAVVVTWEGERLILFIERAGSGARYEREGVWFWESHNELTFDYHGDTVVCETA